MKCVVAVLLVLPLLFASAFSEEAARSFLREADLSQLEILADEEDVSLDDLMDLALSGESMELNKAWMWIKNRAGVPITQAFEDAAGMLPPIIMLVLLGSMMPAGRGGTNGVRFLMRILLLSSFSECVLRCMDAAAACMQTAKRFTDAAAPVLSAFTAAAGMQNTAALLSPMAAIAGNLTENAFLQYGIPLCKYTLCTSIAGNLSPAMNLQRFTQMLKKGVTWGSGLCITLFTALLALQGNVVSSLDTVAIRTAKYAVDSASSIIGSGVSDAWDGYVSGIMIAKNSVGFSGIILLFAAVVQPVLQCAASMVLLNVVSGLLDVLGEKTGCNAAAQMSGVCQMCLMLSCSALAVGTILLGNAMALGRGLFA